MTLQQVMTLNNLYQLRIPDFRGRQPFMVGLTPTILKFDLPAYRRQAHFWVLYFCESVVLKLQLTDYLNFRISRPCGRKTHVDFPG